MFEQSSAKLLFFAIYLFAFMISFIATYGFLFVPVDVVLGKTRYHNT